MKIRTQKRLLYLLGTLFLVAAVGLVAAAFLIPPSLLNETAIVAPTRTPELPKLWNMEDFRELFAVRLQGPLVDPPPPVTVPVEIKETKPVVQFPTAIVLQGILYSKESAIAIFKFNNEIVRCVQGDTIGGAKVNQILEDEVVFEFGGKEFRRAVKN